MGRSYSHLSREQRQVIADSLAIGKSAKDIAVTLSLHISTVYREIERGKNPDTNKYEPEFSENKYQSNLADKGWMKSLTGSVNADSDSLTSMSFAMCT